MKRNIKYSIFLVPHNLSGIAMQLMDRFFIANMLTVSQAGIYALGGQISGILGVINTLLNRGVTPNILRAFKEDNLEYLRNIANIYIIFVVILSLFFSLFSRNIINIIAPNEYQQAYMVINILVVYFIYQMYYFMVVGVLFYVEKATKFIPLITTFSLFLNLIFNYLFIKLFGMIGAAIATSLSMMIVTYIVIFIADKYIKVGFNHLKIHFYILIALVISNAKFIFNLKFALKITILSMLITLFFFLERNNVLIKSFKRKIYEKVFN
jgi:O-antigen/teichoic acid export membrane protein